MEEQIKLLTGGVQMVSQSKTVSVVLRTVTTIKKSIILLYLHLLFEHENSCSYDVLLHL